VTRQALVAFGAAALLGCEWLPRFTVPQVRQARESFEGGFRSRLDAHQACTGAAQTVDGLIACMQGKGYEFITRRPLYPANECWDLRDRSSTDPMPQAFCFERTAAAP